MGNNLHLESFDQAERHTPQSHPEYLRGLEEGRSAINEENVVLQKALHQDLIAAFSDANFTYVEARQAVLLELQPILSAMCSSVLPQLATAGLSSVILDMLTNLTADAVPSHPTVSVHPDHLDNLTAALSNHPTIKATLYGDTSVPRHAAWLNAASGASSVDFQNVIAAINSALDSFTQPNLRKTENG